MHKFNHQEFPDHPHVVYPGTLFAGYHADLEENARGQQRGFVIVEFEETVRSVEFVPVENAQYEIIEVDANNRKADSVNLELEQKAKDIDPAGKIVIIKVRGELTSGKTADVDISSVREKLSSMGSLVVNISKNKLTSKEYSITEAKGNDKDEVETNVFKENIGQLRFEHKELLGEQGVEMAKKLLRELGQPQLANEKKNEYIPRIRGSALSILGLEDDS